MTKKRIQFVRTLYNVIMLSVLAGMVLFPVSYFTQEIYSRAPAWTETVPQILTLALGKTFLLTLAIYIWQYHARRDYVEIHVRHMREGYRLVGFIMMCVVAAGALAVVSVLAARAGLMILAVVVYPFLVLTISVCGPVYARTIRLDSTLESITLASVQPVKRILYHDFRMMLGLSGALLGVVLLVGLAVIPVARVMRITGSVSVPLPYTSPGVYSPSIALFDGDTPLPQEAPPTIVYIDAPTLTIPRTIRDQAERVARIIAVIFAVGGAALLLIVLPAVIIRAIYMFIKIRREGRSTRKSKILQQNKLPPVYDERHDDDEREFVFPFLQKRHRRPVIPTNPIRRAFRDKIMEHIKRGAPIHVSDTPTDMVKRIKNEDLTQLAARYCETRYK